MSAVNPHVSEALETSHTYPAVLSSQNAECGGSLAIRSVPIANPAQLAAAGKLPSRTTAAQPVPTVRGRGLERLLFVGARDAAHSIQTYVIALDNGPVSTGYSPTSDGGVAAVAAKSVSPPMITFGLLGPAVGARMGARTAGDQMRSGFKDGDGAQTSRGRAGEGRSGLLAGRLNARGATPASPSGNAVPAPLRGNLVPP